MDTWIRLIDLWAIVGLLVWRFTDWQHEKKQHKTLVDLLEVNSKILDRLVSNDELKG